ncbi:hypothetical protein KAW38_05015 [Candidatus Micrarchaeota archaeon]|nr:hypothetical protein [Candidatus Micrarchaeota archaeon]
MLPVKSLRCDFARRNVKLTSSDVGMENTPLVDRIRTPATIRVLSALYCHLKKTLSIEPNLAELGRMLKDARILEIGSGSRGTVHILAELGFDCRFFALDMLELPHHEKVTNITGDAFNVDTPQNIDFILASGLLSVGGMRRSTLPDGFESIAEIADSSHELVSLVLNRYPKSVMSVASLFGVLALDSLRFPRDKIEAPIWELTEPNAMVCELMRLENALQLRPVDHLQRMRYNRMIVKRSADIAVLIHSSFKSED